MEPLSWGLRNSVTKLRLDSFTEPLLLRIFNHDPALCQKEIDLYQLISDSVPVPEIIYAQPDGTKGLPPFTVAHYVDGITFLELKRSGQTEAIAEAAYSVGQTLAAIGRIRFDKPGRIGPGITVAMPLLQGANPVPRFVDACLATDTLKERIPSDLIDRTHKLVWLWAPALAGLDTEARLVHCDFSRRNLIMRRIAGRWSVATVLDWEFAVAGSPLWDIANFLRHDPISHPHAEPHFSTGFLQAGGAGSWELPRNWRRLARVLDLAALCEVLTRDVLPITAIGELVELVQETINEND